MNEEHVTLVKTALGFVPMRVFSLDRKLTSECILKEVLDEAGNISSTEDAEMFMAKRGAFVDCGKLVFGGKYLVAVTAKATKTLGIMELQQRVDMDSDINAKYC